MKYDKVTIIAESWAEADNLAAVAEAIFAGSVDLECLGFEKWYAQSGYTGNANKLLVYATAYASACAMGALRWYRAQRQQIATLLGTEGCATPPELQIGADPDMGVQHAGPASLSSPQALKEAPRKLWDALRTPLTQEECVQASGVTFEEMRPILQMLLNDGYVRVYQGTYRRTD